MTPKIIVTSGVPNMKTHKHTWAYKIMSNHEAADVCTTCGKIKKQGRPKKKRVKMIYASGSKAIAAALSMIQ